LVVEEWEEEGEGEGGREDGERFPPTFLLRKPTL
jgi:hypothetical protein